MGRDPLETHHRSVLFSKSFAPRTHAEVLPQPNVTMIVPIVIAPTGDFLPAGAPRFLRVTIIIIGGSGSLMLLAWFWSVALVFDG